MSYVRNRQYFSCRLLLLHFKKALRVFLILPNLLKVCNFAQQSSKTRRSKLSTRLLYQQPIIVRSTGSQSFLCPIWMLNSKSKLFRKSSHLLQTKFVIQWSFTPTNRKFHMNQFQGKQVYGTICNHCQYRSERTSDFLEIEINLEVRIILSTEPSTSDGLFLIFSEQL